MKEGYKRMIHEIAPHIFNNQMGAKYGTGETISR